MIPSYIIAVILHIFVFTLSQVAEANPHNCQTCHAFGKTRQPNQNFVQLEGCREYNCHCACDGSWDCPAENIKDACGPVCSTCIAGYEIREGNQAFQMTEGCFQYECFCKCDGSWNCPTESAVNICTTNATTGCSYCTVDGNKQQGNSRFKHTDGCIEYSCTCNCDGSWDCPAEQAVDRCNTDAETGCYNCDVDGHTYKGNTYFKHVNGCIEFDNCLCNCDGSWSCPGGEHATDICRQNRSSGCYFCEVDGYLHQGNSKFDLVRDCYKYPGCDCSCDGGWTCKHTRGVYVCDDRGRYEDTCTQCNIDGNMFKGNSMFHYDRECFRYLCTCDCAGGFLCRAEDAVYKCTDSAASDGAITLSSGIARTSDGSRRVTRQAPNERCRNCVINGATYSPYQKFKLDSGCNTYNCLCKCDGSWNCPPEETVNKCLGPTSGGKPSDSYVSGRYDGASSVNTCTECNYLGVSYQGNTPFEFEKACWRYRCNCRCNGSVDCPSDKSEYICPGRKKCVKCDVGEDTLIASQTDFVLRRGCIVYEKCRCNCDGSWHCDDGRDECDRCQGCRVDGFPYPGNSTFTLSRGCDKFTNCFCDCDGKWSCSGEGIEDLCGTCRKCSIGGEYYAGGTSGFSATVDCTRYSRCDCRCDGSYTCTGGVYTCDNRADMEVEDQCTDCVHGLQSYRPGQRFDFESGCSSYRNCECKCGRTHCRQVIDSCGDCRSCQIDGIAYNGGTKFSYKKGCLQYSECDCFCNGEWKCYGTSATNTCSGCKKCNVNDKLYDPYSKFTMNQDCWEYQCFCGCDGATRCPSDTVINTCTRPDECRTCEVDGRTVNGNTHFSYKLNEIDMSCRCNCDGSYICIAEWVHVREDYSISGSGIGSGVGSCFRCYINNRYYAGNTNFTITRQGIQMQCQCMCNGGYYCSGLQTFEYQGCRSCSLFGQRYSGGTSFSLIYGGFKLGCKCSCNGGYVCLGADSSVVITCQDGTGCLPSTCSKCVVDGQAFNGGARFGTIYKNTELQCDCGCDGSYYCEGGNNFIISCANGRCTEVGCSGCQVYDNTIEGGNSFELIYRGTKLTCLCECGGDYQCQGGTGQLIITCVNNGAGCLTGACSSCYVDGNSYATSSTFRFSYQGFDMLCTCACDGSYYCKGVSELIEIGCYGGTCNRIGCGTCSVFGTEHTGDNSFEIIYSGLKLACQCSCDGSYICTGSTGQRVVSCINGVGCLGRSCGSCVVSGREYAGLSTFRSEYKGIDLLCTCGCDGSSYCAGTTTSVEVSCVNGVCTRIGCRECNLFGKEYLGSSQFELLAQGLQWNCECDCEGGYICLSTSTSSRITCVGGVGPGCFESTCGTCRVDGREYQAGSQFNHNHNGINFRCTCSCDSSYHCVGVTELIEISCVGGTCNPIGCESCVVSGQTYSAASKFEAVFRGIKLQCTCSCDGSYICYGDSGSTVVQCRNGRGTCLPSSCRSCFSNGRQYEAQSVYRDSYNGIDVSCTCGCDGSSFCVGVSFNIKVSCLGGTCSPVGCTNCMLFGREFNPLVKFDIVYTGKKLSCQCDCAGGYICTDSESVTSLECRNNRGCVEQVCNNCLFDGRNYRGFEIFKYTYNDIDMSCACGCDSSVNCLGILQNTELRCVGNNCEQLGCVKCSAFGQDYDVLSSFQLYYNGLKLSCECECNGGFVCKGSTGITELECGYGDRDCVSNTCRNCIRNGQTIRGGSTYRDKYEGIDVTCTCACDGSSYCVGVYELIEISCIGGTCTPLNCRSCRVFGRGYAALSTFTEVYNGQEMSCRCNCDSSYICKSSTNVTIIECRDDGGNCLPQQCRNCVLDGQSYRARSIFPYKYKNIDMSCTCGCDGTSYCEGISEYIIISCTGDGCSPRDCRSCNLFGREYPALVPFDIVYQGIKLNCSCSCDSSYECVGKTGQNVVDCKDGRNCLPTVCNDCILDGNRYRARSNFPYKYKNIDMQCSCGCDGTSYCEGVEINIIVSCTGNGCSPRDCRDCNIFGIDYPALVPFDIIYQGVKLDCDCACDSSYVCKGSTGDTVLDCKDGRNCVAPSTCRNCVVAGRTYPARSTFPYRYRDIDMQCRCGCDGTSYCEGTSVSIIVSCTGSGCSPVNCRDCNLFGRSYPALVPFDIIYQGVKLDCSCSCDSSYICKGSTGQTVVECKDGRFGRDCLAPRCNDCVLDGRTYSARSTFAYRYRDIDMQCRCGCDGTSYCEGTSVSIIVSCTGSGCSPVNCRDCNIFGRSYPALVPFDVIYQGVKLDCSCSCDSSYICKGSTGQTVLECKDGRTGRDCLAQRCNDCVLDGRTYSARSTFAYRYRDIDMQCRCGCDGTSYCEGTSVSIIVSCTGSGCSPVNCRDCNIFGRSYPALVPFDVIYQGVKLDCSCSCDSSYICKGSSGQTVVECKDGRTGRDCLAPRCNDCVLDGRTYSARSTFAYRYRDIDMQCRCGCDGTSYCEGTSVSIIVSCTGSGCSPVNCRDCNIFGRSYPALAPFDIIYQGVKLDCSCSCDSSYICKGSTGQTVVECKDGRFGRDCLAPRCNDCVLDGRTYSARSTFAYRYRDIDMQCRCGCDGTSYCEGTSVSIIVSCTGSGCSPVNCRDCNIFGRNYPALVPFNIVYQGVKLDCSCSCDSSYICKGSTGDSVVNCKDGENCLAQRCSNCVVDGRRYNGLSTFPYRYKDIDMNCQCGCDGTAFCQGTSVSIEVSCVGSGCYPVGCQNCNLFGKEYAGDSSFDIVYQGVELACNCNCDTSYICQGSSKNINCRAGRRCLPRRCKKCRANGERFDGLERFNFEYRGIQMSCMCGCDGSYFCEGVSSSLQISCDRSGRCTQVGGCLGCSIFGTDIDGGSRKEYVYQGKLMTCTCDCNSGYRCERSGGEKVVNCVAGKTCLPNRCNTCLVDGNTYNGLEQFNTLIQSINAKCTCGCDGSYFCRGRNNEELSCDRRGNCERLDCIECISDGRTYQAEAEFAKNYDGIGMNCLCSCDGSYRCQGVSTKITITCDNDECRLVGCRSCLVNGQEYKRGDRYETKSGSRRKECICECDGSSTCNTIEEPQCKDCIIDGDRYKGHTRQRVYKAGVSYICDCFCTGEGTCTAEGPVCNKCTISGKEYPGNGDFFANMNQEQMKCFCKCDGSWECNGERSQCTSSRGCVDTCRQCLIGGRKYDQNINFMAVISGERMQCDCKCDGSFYCSNDNRICTERSCESKCRKCVIDGVDYSENQRFMATASGTRMQCSCDCNGFWKCISDTKECTSTGCRDICTPCSIDGREYQDRNFETVIKDIVMQCSCDCSGSYECTGGSLRCTSLLGCVDTCQGCEIEGKRYAGNTRSTIFHNAYGINMDCDCECGGSYTCKGTKTNICHGQECANNRCWDCVINGIRYQGDSSFDTVIDGVPVECTCHCSGGHKCVGKITQEFCSGPGCSPQLDENRCRSCYFDGQEYPGGRPFEIQYNNVPMVCECSCGGNLTCRGERTQYCIGDGCEERPKQCLSCHTEDGRVITGNTRFTLTRDGKTVECTCGCNGGYNCERTECRGAHCGSTGCRRCIIDDIPYTGNTRFSLTKGSVDYTCSCFCDGSYTCTSSSGFETSCVGETCAADRCRPCRLDGREYKLDTRFRLLKNRFTMNCVCECDGAYRCFSIIGSCVGNQCDDYGCSSCTIDGRQYKGNQDHQVRPGLICSCGCDGQYECRSSMLSVTCIGDDCGTDRCKRCEIEGEYFPGNQRFTYTRYGLLMQCVCNCDSSYTCRGYQIISSGTDTVETWCGTCEIAGRIFNGNTRFQIMINGTRQVCSCYCNGQHSCEGSTDACRECVIGNNKYPSNRDFTLRRGRDSIKCSCECNGDFTCKGLGTQPCQGDECTIDGCKQCLIFGLTYKGNTRFTTDARGVRMLCECSCDGSYTCKGYRSVTNVFIPGETVESCKTCYVGGASKQGNTKFRIQRACFSIECICGCDGTWECPYQTPKYVCNDQQISEQKTLQTFYSISGEHIYTSPRAETGSSSSRIIYPEPSTTIFGQGGKVETTCSDCTVGRNTYEGDTNFVLQDGCLRWTCGCDCSGSWNCTSVEGSACSGPLDPFAGKECQECQAFGRQYPAEQEFKANDECYQYTCMCNCDGSWECPRELTVQTCIDPSKIYSEAKGNCRHCQIGTTSYSHKETFQFINECIQYLCTCNCDGSYDCPGSTAVRVCRGGSGASGRIAGTGSKTVSQTVVGLRPVGYGTSKTGYSQTGGGYSIVRNEYESAAPDSGRESIANYNGKTVTLLGRGGGSDAGKSYTETRTRTGVRYTSGSGGSGFSHESGTSGGGAAGSYVSQGGSRTSQGTGGSVGQGGGSGYTSYTSSSGASGSGTVHGGVSRTGGTSYTSYTSSSSGTSGSGATRTGGSQAGASQAGTSQGGSSYTSYTSSGTPGTGESRTGTSQGGSRTGMSQGGGSSYTSYTSSGSSGTGGSRTGTSQGGSRTGMSQGGGSSYTSYTSSGSSGTGGSRTGTSQGGSRTGTSQGGGSSYTSYTSSSSSSSGTGAHSGGSRSVTGAQSGAAAGQSRDNGDCRNCVVEGQSLPWGRDFTFRSGCFEYSCECFCDGSYECPAHKTTNVCEGARPETGTSGKPLECKVDNRTFRTKIFTYTRDCYKFTCRCDDNGSFTCDNALTKYVC